MYSIPVFKDKLIIGDGVHLTEQHQSQKATASPSNDDKTQKDDSEIKIKETAKSTPEPVKDVNKPEVLSSTSAAEETAVVVSPRTKSVEIEEIKSIPSTSTVSIEVATSTEPNATGSTDTQPSAGRILLKRRRSRISIPIVYEPSSSIVEVDSAPPRPSKRRSQKKQMIALFSESDYPRRK